MHVFKQGLDGNMYKITLDNFILHGNLEMTLNTFIERWHFVDGQPVSSYTEYIAGLEGNEMAKARILSNNRQFQAPANTAGSFVNPQTGEKVPAGTEGAITELAYWQAIPLDAFVGATTLSQCVYASIEQALTDMQI